MSNKRFLICLIATGFAIWSASVHAESRYSADDFGALPKVIYASLAPDGSKFAYLAPVQGKQQMFVRSRGGDRTPAPIQVIDRRIDWFRWLSSDRLLVALRFPGERNGVPTLETRLMVVDHDGGNRRDLTITRGGITPQVQTNLIDILSDDSDHVLLDLTLNDTKSFDAYRLNVNTGALKRVAEGTANTARWIADAQGNVRVRVDFQRRDKRIYRRALSNGRWRQMERYTVYDDPDLTPLGFGTDPNLLYVSSNHELDRDTVYEYDLQRRRIGNKIYGHPSVDISGLIRTKESRLLGVYYAVDDVRAHYFDREANARQKAIDRAMPQTANLIVSSADDDQTHIILSTGDRYAGGYYFFDQASGGLEKIADRYPQLKTDDMARIERFSYKARDGLDIPAYLTLPKGAALQSREGKKWPLIVMPHGGPRLRDYREFDYMSHFLADRGWAVLKPNFRGSAGYGAAFEEKGYKHWGDTMQDDIADGARALVKSGFADPERVCIVGGSFGGYAALMNVIREPDLYQCAVSLNGVSDLHQFLVDAWRYRFADLAAVRVGHPVQDRDLLVSSSPIQYADQIRVPVLLIHSELDRRVPKRHSENMAEALKKAGKRHELMILREADHNLMRATDRKAYLRLIEGFLNKHLKATDNNS